MYALYHQAFLVANPLKHLRRSQFTGEIVCSQLAPCSRHARAMLAPLASTLHSISKYIVIWYYDCMLNFLNCCCYFIPVDLS